MVTEVVSAVLQTSFLGDMVLTTPLLERLAREGPVHVVATPANAGVLANHPAVASVIVFDKRRSDAGWRGFARVAARLRAVGASRAFLAQGSLRTAALALMARIPVRIGFDRSAGRLLYTRRVHYRAEWHHAARLWSLATAADAPHSESAPALRPSLYPGATEDAQVDGLLQQAGLDIDTPLIALAPGSVWATKRWPHYPDLAAALLQQLPSAAAGARLVVIGAASDAPLAAAIAERAHATQGPPVIDATGALSLLGSAALLARCRVLVTNDSAPLHLASAMNTPTVALFGPTVPSLGFGPLAERQAVLGVHLPCRPCHAHGPQQCPLGHWDCMRTMAPDTVLRSVHTLTQR
ncbi:MAG TPA: lipopolysaccharide heptosyltransferase II [Gemmatimonas aurantiaca]|uniref:lipopolysaccharide heptosyltransferase II n=2 Tax=Gemmatimonas aurantiaca TaxID=173480 RepID=C1A9L8_GEMAT|nr:lipopolysaccharide heptosyltransferase II [Gemmatimonas aurantiaca]BAH39195.1 putative heptosyltransferase [Gemmatimonas aurantiaca T-27]HCT57494.1 lipopolysaccharide heptosyltransferase II [Gemmatimonas aurantiaca]